MVTIAASLGRSTPGIPPPIIPFSPSLALIIPLPVPSISLPVPCVVSAVVAAVVVAISRVGLISMRAGRLTIALAVL